MPNKLATSNPPTRPFPGYAGPTYTMVPDELFDDQLPDLSGAEIKALLYIIRRTFGFKKQSDNISLNQLLTGIVTGNGTRLDRGTGLSRSALVAALKSLVDKNMIVAEHRASPEKGNQATNYRLNVATPPSTKIELGGYENRTSLVRKSNPQQTVKQETEFNVVVVGALREFGLSQSAAEHLTTTYPEEYLLQKLDLAQWLVSSNSPLVSKNPAGYLRKAIEDDYTPPRRYKNKADRGVENQEEEHVRDEAQLQRRAVEEDVVRAKAVQQARLVALYPPQVIPLTTLTTEDAWQQSLDELRSQMTAANFAMWLSHTVLASCTATTATIVAISTFQRDWLRQRLHGAIAEALAAILGYTVQCDYVALDELPQPDR